jgi:tRNA A-37 threonylcarbamoyl transferase component Bud32
VTDRYLDLPEVLAPEFEVLRPLGEGGTGKVYLAQEVELHRLVAIKVPRPTLAQDPVVRARFEREARAVARLRHPSAAAVHRIGHLPNGTPYLVLEYLDGRTLDEILQAEGPLPKDLTLELLIQVAGGLEEAHAHGVIHRDVRPNNVFWLPQSERAVLSDFGIAGILETGSEVVTQLTMPGEPLGSPAYRSPEHLMGEPLTPAADIYGFGLLAYEALTGQGPYVVERPERHEELSAAHLRQPPQDLRELWPEASPRLADLLLRCLAKEPRLRPSASGVVRELRQVRSEAEIRQRSGTMPVGVVGGVLEGFPAVAQFLGELKRRRVFNVAAAYAAIGFLVLQGADMVLPVLPVPPWSYDVLVAVALAGFPVALVLGWMYDLTFSGIQRAEPAWLAGPSLLRWLLPAAGLAFSLAVAGLIGWWILGSS